MNRQRRFAYYSVFIIGSLIIPFLLTILFIAISGKRETGMIYGLLASIVSINFIFGYKFLQASFLLRIASALVITAIGSIAVLVSASLDLQWDFDRNGFWRSILSYLTISVLSWEMIYKITTRKKF